MSTARCFGFIFAAACLHAQLPAPPRDIRAGGVSSLQRAAPSPDFVPLLTASGDVSVGGDPDPLTSPMEPDVFGTPMHSAQQPISGVVSLRELEHPIPKKALRAAFQAERLVRAHRIDKAIAKLQEAIRIDPQYRDAHVNLGVQYARIGRTAKARAEFQKALDIGPPAAPIYTDLALISLAREEYWEAEVLARKALDLEPGNAGAKRIFEYASTH